MRIYLHTEGKLEPEAVEAEDDVTLSELLGEAAEDVVFLREDEGNVLDADSTLAQSKVGDRGHVFAGKHAKVEVEVQYNGPSKTEHFAASARVERVLKWAVGKKGFDLSKADAAEHTLAIASTGAIPPSDAHVGSLPQDKPGHVLLSLIPKKRFEG